MHRSHCGQGGASRRGHGEGALGPGAAVRADHGLAGGDEVPRADQQGEAPELARA